MDLYLLERKEDLLGTEEQPPNMSNAAKRLMATVTGKNTFTPAYASVNIQSGSRRRVVSDPKGVARELVSAIKKVFRPKSEDNIWFRGLTLATDTSEGRAQRIRIADEGDNVDMEALGIPRKFKKILKRLKRLSKVTPAMYAQTIKAITSEEWKALWKARKKGTAPGKFKVTVDMLAALPDDILDDLMVLVNTVLQPGGGIFRAWRRRVIVPIPKTQHDNGVDNTRPINFLGVIMKGFWAIIIARIQKVWENNGLLHDMQFAFRGGIRMEAPVLLATMLSEKHNNANKPLYACA